uniref:Triacylglycerol lipase n=1 Tax=Candidozyma auris TaxID=498019 RepID=A0A0L0NUA5_CANAR
MPNQFNIYFLIMLPQFLTILLWSAFALAFLTKPVAPSDDSFYEVPQNISDYENGDIINVRNTPVQVRSFIFPMEVKNSWQVLVRSEDSFGNPNAIVATILEPYNAIPSKVWSYQIWEDANDLDCAPSYALLFKASYDTISSQTEIPIIQYGLSKGWYVVVPDYEGPKSAFTMGRQSGHAVLDGIRAALSSGYFTGINRDANVGLYGYSGGALATGWAAQIQPLYAPEIKDNIIGAAIGGWVTNVTNTAIVCDGTLFSGLIASGLNGIYSENSQYKEVLDRNLDASKKADFYKAKSLCVVNSVISYLFQNFFLGITPYFITGKDYFNIPINQEIFGNNTAALRKEDGVPEIPLFVFHGQDDEIAPVEQPTRAFENFCSWGAPSIEMSVAASTGHILEILLGTGAGLAWLEKRFDGNLPIEGCLKTVRTTNLEYPGADAPYLQILEDYIEGLFGAKVGLDTSDISNTSWLVKVLAYAISKFVGLIGPIPFKRDGAAMLLLEKAGNRTVDEMYKGLLDLRKLMEAQGMDPLSVLMGTPITL